MSSVIINACYGGFGLSDEALHEYEKRTGTTLDYEFATFGCPRWDPVWVQIVRDLGKKASGPCAKLTVIDLDPNFACGYHIDEYDGMERLVFDKNRFVMNKLKMILKQELSSDEKIKHITELTNTKYPNHRASDTVDTDDTSV